MLNMLPGQGLGFTGSQDLAFGLWSMGAVAVVESYGGTSNWRRVDAPYKQRKPRHRVTKREDYKKTVLVDSVYVAKNDDDELFDLIKLILEVME